MKKIALAVSLAAMTGLGACTATEQRAVAGGAIGAGTGALVGGLVTDSREGALVGAAVGGVGGAAIGAGTTPRRDCYRAANGRVYCN